MQQAPLTELEQESLSSEEDFCAVVDILMRDDMINIETKRFTDKKEGQTCSAGKE